MPEDKSANGSLAGENAAQPLVAISSELLADVKVMLEVRLGTGTMPVRDLLALKPGSSLVLDTPLNGVVDILLNNAIVARGEVVAVGDQYAIRITSVAPAEK